MHKTHAKAYILGAERSGGQESAPGILDMVLPRWPERQKRDPQILQHSLCYAIAIVRTHKPTREWASGRVGEWATIRVRVPIEIMLVCKTTLLQVDFVSKAGIKIKHDSESFGIEFATGKTPTFERSERKKR